MFKKTERLSKPEFTAYFKTGARHHHPAFTIITHPGKGKRQVAVVVGKKVAKSATRRNTLSRRIYALLRNALPTNFKQVMVVVTKPKFNTLTRTNASKQLQEAIAEVVKNT